MQNIAKVNRSYTKQNFSLAKSETHVLWKVRALFLWLAFVNIASSTDEMGRYIRKCCQTGILYAANQSTCAKYVHEIVSLPPFWRGLCHSAHSVCCSSKLDEQYCVSGRLAALRGSRCDELHYTPSYIHCCRVCQIGLAVKASNKDCSNVLFSFFQQIETYHVCCLGGNYDFSRTMHLNTVRDLQGNDTNAESNIYWNISEEEIIIPDKKLFSNANDGTVVQQTDEDASETSLNDKKVHSSTDPKNGNNIGLLQCKSGYKVDNKRGRCVDVDECASNLDDCQGSQYCHNTIGSYHCLNVNSKACYLNKGNCDKACSAGFQYINDSCFDIDECAQDANACDSNQLCSNDIGGYRCDCKIGFNLDTITNGCVDINECSINNHNCLPTQRCDNTYGSFICIRLQSCGTGYTLNAETGNCDDDDECTLDTHNCPNDYECHNTKGSFRCHRRILLPAKTSVRQLIFTAIATTTPVTPTDISTNRSSNPLSYNNRTKSLLSCEIGFRRNHLDICVDLNECTQGDSCGSQQRCVNTIGSYRCLNIMQCSTGFHSTSDGTQCIDIDECESGEHQCVHNQICRNHNGGYVCSCPPGHQLFSTANAINRCIDLNECQQKDQPLVCPPNSHCHNTVGSYYCECGPAFRKSKVDEQICLDVDECREIPGLCHQKCVNYWGGYRCACNEGFEISADNRTCSDVNECEVHKTYKLCMGYCNNMPGSYECSCPRGYTIGVDKSTCNDIDECATGEFCTGRNDICTNIHGSFKCTTMHCKYGYINDPDQKNRCRLTSDFCEGQECYNVPSAYTFNFITLVSKLGIPPEGRIIFSLRGPLWYDSIDFDWKITKILAAANIEAASEKYFDTINGNRELHLQLKRSLEGPQEVEVEISMTVFSKGMLRGKSVAKIFILVSQYTF